MGVVVCGKRCACTERGDQALLDEVAKYYHAHRLVDDASAVDDEIIKVAIFDLGPAERTTAPALASFADTHRVVVSSEHWIDVMNRSTDKGKAVRRLQEHLGISAAQTMMFGDYLNDLGMLDAAAIRRTRHLAPTNTDDRVVRTIRNVLDTCPRRAAQHLAGAHGLPVPGSAGPPRGGKLPFDSCGARPPPCVRTFARDRAGPRGPGAKRRRALHAGGLRLPGRRLRPGPAGARGC